MFKKPSRTVRRVFLHHSATDNKKHDNVFFIYKVHVEQNKWLDIGYHFFITKDGEVHHCRPLENRPAAQKGHNKASIAICLSGRKKFTDKQKASLHRLCAEINASYDRVTFHGHKEVANTLCPAYPYREWLNLNDEGRIAPKLTKPKPTTIWERLKNWWNKLGEKHA